MVLDPFSSKKFQGRHYVTHFNKIEGASAQVYSASFQVDVPELDVHVHAVRYGDGPRVLRVVWVLVRVQGRRQLAAFTRQVTSVNYNGMNSK